MFKYEGTVSNCTVRVSINCRDTFEGTVNEYSYHRLLTVLYYEVRTYKELSYDSYEVVLLE